jgi:hypothetical protein
MPVPGKLTSRPFLQRTFIVSAIHPLHTLAALSPETALLQQVFVNFSGFSPRQANSRARLTEMEPLKSTLGIRP